MTKEEYEQLYRDALAAIVGRGFTVGDPYYAHGEVRAVRINDFPCIDDQVFETSWGKDAAIDIVQRRAGAREPEAGPGGEKGT